MIVSEPTFQYKGIVIVAAAFPGEVIWTIETVAFAAVTAPTAAMDRPNRSDFIMNGSPCNP